PVPWNDGRPLFRHRPRRASRRLLVSRRRSRTQPVV
ncbi:uncharacterized protein METZ01_LOCUS469296, partial [marine metagenome]